jgi:prophage regulatory protein
MNRTAIADSGRAASVAPRIFVRLPTVLATTGLGRSTIYRLVADGSFPSPVKLGPRAVAWRWADIESWGRSRSDTLSQHLPAIEPGRDVRDASGQGRAQPGASASLTRRGAR